MKTFSRLVEKVKELSLDEKQELHLLLEKFLIEARRDEIKKNYSDSKRREKKLKFSGNVDELKKLVRR